MSQKWKVIVRNRGLWKGNVQPNRKGSLVSAGREIRDKERETERWKGDVVCTK